MTVGEVLRAAAEYLTAKASTPRASMPSCCSSQALGLSRIELYTQHDRPLTEAERAAARALVERRGRREPLAYVLGEWGFRRLTLRPTRARSCRGPRRRSWSSAASRSSRASGAARRRRRHGLRRDRARDRRRASRRRVVATDLSEDALALAARTPNGSGSRSSSSGRACSTGLFGPFDLVVSNPPYVLAGGDRRARSRRSATGSRGSRSSTPARPRRS